VVHVSPGDEPLRVTNQIPIDFHESVPEYEGNASPLPWGAGGLIYAFAICFWSLASSIGIWRVR
jgi:hypothetical protein